MKLPNYAVIFGLMLIGIGGYVAASGASSAFENFGTKVILIYTFTLIAWILMATAFQRTVAEVVVPCVFVAAPKILGRLNLGFWDKPTPSILGVDMQMSVLRDTDVGAAIAAAGATLVVISYLYTQRPRS